MYACKRKTHAHSKNILIFNLTDSKLICTNRGIPQMEEEAMEDMDRYNEMNDQIACLETFFDVFQVVAKHGLLGEVKGTSISYLLGEVSEKVEAIKRLNKDTYNRLQDLKRLTGVKS